MLGIFTDSSAHTYSLAASGIKFKSAIYSTRDQAKYAMYEYVGKNKLHITDVYDDKHDKTYCCDNGVRFYIIRN